MWVNVVLEALSDLMIEVDPDLRNTRTRKVLVRRVSKLMKMRREDRKTWREECRTWVNAVLKTLSDLLMEADPEVRIELRNFGVLSVKKTKAKPQARNPRTNETVFIPSRRKTHFKPSKRIKDRLQTPLVDLDYQVPSGSADST